MEDELHWFPPVDNTTTMATEEPLWLLMKNTTDETLPIMEEEAPLAVGSTAAMVLPRITATLSLLAVVCVFVEALMDLRQARESSVAVSARDGSPRIRSSRAASNIHTVNHIQLCYQIPLFCYSLAQALGSNVVRSDLDVWGALGNTATCSFQGFLISFGVLGIMGWDAALSLAYLGMTRWPDRFEQVKDRRQKLCHCIIWPVSLAVSLYPLTMGLYNFSGFATCWIREFPVDCVGDECIRGASATTWSSLISLGVMLHLIYSIAIMICLYCTLRRMEDRTQMDGSNTAATTASRTYSRAVGVQGVLYASGMVITTLPTATYMIVYNVAGVWSEGLSTFGLTMSPLVGYVNFCIYMRNRRVCHTRYAKLLRRAHSWMFDFHFRCKCECECLPRFGASRKSHTGVTDPTTRVAPQGGGDGWQAKRAKPNPEPKRTRKKGGKWFGVTIQTKRQESNLVSELGLSSAGQSPTDWGDEPPSLPTRDKSRDETPPTAPVRLLSELLEGEDIPSDSLPRRPIRYMSDLEMDTIPEEGPPSKPLRCATDIETIVEETERTWEDSLPSKPIRYCSEEAGTPSKLQFREPSCRQPPTKPLRYQSGNSELEWDEESLLDDDRPAVRVGAHHEPVLPSRFVSDITEPSFFEDESDTSDGESTDDDSLETTVYSYAADKEKRPPSKPKQIHRQRTSSDQHPPSKPMRYHSEVSKLDFEGESLQEEAIPCRAIHKSARGYVSEITEPSFWEEASSKEQAPSKPMRYETDMSESEDSSVEAPAANPARFTTEAETSMLPSRPVRHDSEIEP